MARKNRSKTYILLILVALVFGTVGLYTSFAADRATEEKRQEPTQQKEEYEKSMEERLRLLGKQLDELTARAADMTDEARKELQSYISEAEKKRDEAARKLKELRQNSEKKWDTFSSQLNAAADDFAKAYEKAKSRFKE